MEEVSSLRSSTEYPLNQISQRRANRQKLLNLFKKYVLSNYLASGTIQRANSTDTAVTIQNSCLCLAYIVCVCTIKKLKYTAWQMATSVIKKNKAGKGIKKGLAISD